MIWKEVVSYWGGFASIVCLLIVVIGSLYKYVGSVRRRVEEDRAALSYAMEKIESIAQESTSQGKRLDLFIYKESVLSDARYYLLRNNIQLIGMICTATVFFLFLYSVDPNDKSLAWYAVNLVLRIMPSTDSDASVTFINQRDMFGLVGLGMLLTILWFFYQIFRIKSSLQKVSKRVSRISNLFIRSSENDISKIYSSGLMLDTTIWDGPESVS